ncbi:hypothetical protein ABZ725_14495 [Streptomyces sp. NPDC006872]|uniref:hypothetical protein n=1 Tax=Streptomyces sp. NPDC006872 TaxID=3155720 RepID=UPI0033CB2134
MPEPFAAESLCEHRWAYNKPAHASASVRICSICHKIDGEDLMRTLNEYTEEQMAKLKQAPTTLLYAHSDGATFSYVDQPGGIPDNGRERAILRGLLTYALAQLDQHELMPDLFTLPRT